MLSISAASLVLANWVYRDPVGTDWQLGRRQPFDDLAVTRELPQ